MKSPKVIPVADLARLEVGQSLYVEVSKESSAKVASNAVAAGRRKGTLYGRVFSTALFVAIHTAGSLEVIRLLRVTRVE